MSITLVGFYVMFNHGAWLLLNRKKPASKLFYPFCGIMMLIAVPLVSFLPEHIWNTGVKK